MNILNDSSSMFQKHPYYYLMENAFDEFTVSCNVDIFLGMVLQGQGEKEVDISEIIQAEFYGCQKRPIEGACNVVLQGRNRIQAANMNHIIHFSPLLDSFSNNKRKLRFDLKIFNFISFYSMYLNANFSM